MRLLLFPALLASACAPGVPAVVPEASTSVAPVLHFDVVADGVLRGGQPDVDQFQDLVRRYGVRSVIKLNHDVEGVDHVPAGVTVIPDALDALEVPDEARLAKILDDIEAAPKPVYIHCTHGKDRTGLVVALYKLRHGASVEEVERDMKAHGFYPWRGVEAAWERARAENRR